jgi:hypothetical protein
MEKQKVKSKPKEKIYQTLVGPMTIADIRRAVRGKPAKPRVAARRKGAKA